jgi:hypothetical protein
VRKSSEESPDGTDIIEVQTLKLHSRNLGLSKGLLIQDKDKVYHRLNDILDLKRAVGGDTFNKKAFLRLYSEYRGYVGK